MSKQEMENAILNGLHQLVEKNDNHDRITKEWYENELKNGYTGDKPFFFNGYVYESDIQNVISTVLFDHSSQDYQLPGKEFIGVARFGGANYKDICTNEEHDKINMVVTGLINRGYIRLSKSGTMAKVLK